MPQWLTFRRTSGRELTAVRRPDKKVALAKATAAKPLLADLKKADLVELAEARGVDPSGRKDELVERLTDA